jgi:putative hydrolase of the HAD superfamily
VSASERGAGGVDAARFWEDAPALGFDLGETLVTYRDTPLSWTDLYGKALRSVAAAVGRELSEEAIRGAEAILARNNTRLHPRTREIPADVIFGEILASWSWPRSLLADVAGVFFGFFQQRLSVYPETLAVLRALKARSARIGVLTDVPYGMPRHLVERDLAEAGLREYVDVLLTSVDVGHRKPAPEGFRRLAETLGVAVEKLIYVGNERKDITGSKAAGARAVLIARRDGDASEEYGQDAAIRSLSELTELR